MTRKSRREIERMLNALGPDIDDIPRLGEIWFQSIQLGQGNIDASREDVDALWEERVRHESESQNRRTPS